VRGGNYQTLGTADWRLQETANCQKIAVWNMACLKQEEGFECENEKTDPLLGPTSLIGTHIEMPWRQPGDHEALSRIS